MMLGKLQRAHPTLHDNFAPAYLVGSDKLRASLFFIYGNNTTTTSHAVDNEMMIPFYQHLDNIMIMASI